MKIAIIQSNLMIGDFDGNTKKALDGYSSGVGQGAHAVVGSETMLWGYPALDYLLMPEMVNRHDRSLEKLKAQTVSVPFIIGVTRKNENDGGMPLFNSVVALQYKVIPIAPQDKALLPDYDVFDERRYFQCGDTVGTFNHTEQTCAILVCEDIWNGSEIPTDRHLYSMDPVSHLEQKGLKILFVVNASPYYWGKGNVRFELVSGIAKRLGCVVVYVNQVGGNDELVFDGRSFAVNAEGKCIAAAKAFEEDVVVFDTDGPEVPYPFDKDDISQLYDSLVLSVRDYARKNNFGSALLGLSGGIDSALTLAIGVDALGAENMQAVMMPSDYTSSMSLEDARAEALAFGVEYSVLPIGNVTDAFGKLLSGEFLGYEEDVTEENIQARTRGVILMAISNKKKSLLLTTGNKSEMAVGYATLYGDMAGGFAPIKDVSKLLVYRLAQYRNTISPVIPERVLTRAPSAELAPGQKDEDSLPPYEVLDPILEMFIEENRSVGDMVQAGFDRSTVERVVRMVERNEYKRRQSPPGTKVTEKAFGGGRRFPIAAKGVSE